MKPRRLHKLTIFSMRWASALKSINRLYSATDLHRLHRFNAENSVVAVMPAAFSKFCRRHACLYSICVIRVYPRLRLGFDRDFGLHRTGDETLLVRHMIHLFDLLRGWLFITGEFEPRP